LFSPIRKNSRADLRNFFSSTGKLSPRVIHEEFTGCDTSRRPKSASECDSPGSADNVHGRSESRCALSAKGFRWLARGGKRALFFRLTSSAKSVRCPFMMINLLTDWRPPRDLLQQASRGGCRLNG